MVIQLYKNHLETLLAPQKPIDTNWAKNTKNSKIEQKTQKIATKIMVKEKPQTRVAPKTATKHA